MESREVRSELELGKMYVLSTDGSDKSTKDAKILDLSRRVKMSDNWSDDNLGRRWTARHGNNKSAGRPKKVRVKVCGVRRGKIRDVYRHAVGRPGYKDTKVFLQQYSKAMAG